MWSDSVVDPGLWNGTAWLDSGPSLLGGTRTFPAWRSPGLSLLGGTGTFTAWRNRDLDSLADSGTFTAWRTPEPSLLGGSGTLTGTGLVSRIDVIGLVWIRNWNLCF